AETEQDALLHPRVYTPAGRGGRIGFGGAHGAIVQSDFEMREQRVLRLRVGSGPAVEQRLDLSLHAFPAHSAMTQIRGRPPSGSSRCARDSPPTAAPSASARRASADPSWPWRLS